MNVLRALSAVATLLLSTTILAQAYPSKPIHIVVGYAPGGGTDLTTRLLAERLRPLLGQPVVVENRPGAGSDLAGAAVARAAPDGYTLFAAAGGIAVNATLSANMNYDPLKDLAPIATVSILPNVLLVNASFPAKTVNELISYAKANPKDVACGSSSTGSTGHFSCELLNQRAGISILHVPFKGSSEAITALLSGTVQVVFDQIPAALAHTKSGRLRAIALTGPNRNDSLPGVPTVDEAGLQGFYANTWVALFAPTGTPPDVIQRLNQSVNLVVQQPEVRERFATMGMETGGGTPEQLRALLETDIAKWRKAIEAANLKPR
jgi:tripartite-type tricarboxylate transporter receptor subunit TctC